MQLSPQTGRAAPARLAITAFALTALLAAPAAMAATSSDEDKTLQAIVSANARLAPIAPVPTDELLRRSLLREVRLSPDGSQVAYLQQTRLQVYDVAQRTSRTLVADNAGGEVSWSADGKFVFIAAPTAVTSVEAATATAATLTALDPKREQRMVGIDSSRSAGVLVEDYDRAARKYKLSSYAPGAEARILYEGRQLRDFLLDTQGKPHFIKTLDDQYQQVISRQTAGGWKEVARCKPARACTLVHASADGSKLQLLTAYRDDLRSLVELDSATGARRLLHADPDAMTDLRRIAADPLSGEPLAAGYDLPHRRNVALTGAASAAMADIAARFPASSIVPTPSAAGKRWLLSETGSRMQQERYWVYDSATRQFEPILASEREQGKALPPERLAGKHPLRYRASDGATIHGYLTLPPGLDAARVPLMTLVHGGPWTRFDAEYHSLVQWLASRGVAVFQPNFRASTGYGDQYMLAPGMDLGNGRIQRDIIEGVQHLLHNGIGDKSRLAIAGDSFGGYSTLLALTHTPEMFRFGLATMPPPDFARIIELAQDENLAGNEDVPTSVRFREMGLDKNNHAAMAKLRAQSPAQGAAHVVRPLVMLAGGKDEKVEIGTVTAYASSLAAAGKPVTLLVEPGEGHSMRKPELRLAYIHFLERLLHEHLGGAEPAAPTAELARYLAQTVKIDNAFRATTNAMP